MGNGNSPGSFEALTPLWWGSSAFACPDVEMPDGWPSGRSHGGYAGESWLVPIVIVLSVAGGCVLLWVPICLWCCFMDGRRPLEVEVLPAAPIQLQTYSNEFQHRIPHHQMAAPVASAPLQGLLVNEDTHRPRGGPMPLGIALP